ncbi:hypothetical protein NUU61_008757 [Penicillium alfredii]|uniref:Uncharacterized protein n=1 Tax=Penicillium alfredii TaxID=1506179 RepID=A0A9W9JWJ2_9EURO|nr:uncharacterized protein NUU61_008757 [Penicillium alfredii]KAJ5084178.1 hypothetical protein NUU61_008757 [Penicillium alfredii]
MDGGKVIAETLGIDQASADQRLLYTAATEARGGAVDVEVGNAAVLGFHQSHGATAGNLTVDLAEVEICVGAHGGGFGQAAQHLNGAAVVLETRDGRVDKGAGTGVVGGGAADHHVGGEGQFRGLGGVHVQVELDVQVVQGARVDVEESIYDGQRRMVWGQIGRVMQGFDVTEVLLGNSALHAQAQGSVDLGSEEWCGQSYHATAGHGVEADLLMGE